MKKYFKFCLIENINIILLMNLFYNKNINEKGVIIIHRKKIFHQATIWIIFLVLSFCCMLPVQYNGNLVLKYLNDAPFHLARALSLSNVFQSPVNFDYFNHTGIPISTCYPWLFLYPLYIIYQLTHQLTLSFYLYFLLVTWATLLTMFYCCKKITHSTRISIMISILYTFATYRISDIYYRHAFGEVIAYTFFPIVLLGIYYVFYQQNKKWMTLAVGMTALAYSHILSLLMGIFLIVGFFIIRFIQRKINWQCITSVMKAAIVSFFASFATIVPILFYSHATKMHMPNLHLLKYEAINISQLFLNSLNNQIGPTLSATIGLILLIILAVSLYKWKEINGWTKDCFILSLCFIIMSTTLFPWDILQNTPIRQIQFPWRLLILASLLLCIVAINYFTKWFSFSKMLIITIGILLLHCATLSHYAGGGMGSVERSNFEKSQAAHKYDDKQLSNIITKKFHRLAGEWDYTPINAQKDESFFNQQKVKINNELKVGHPTYANQTIQFNVQAKQGDKITLPVYSYIGEQVQINNVTVQHKKAKNGGTTLIANQNGVSHIKIQYHYPTSVKLCYVISFITIIMWSLYAIIRYVRT